MDALSCQFISYIGFEYTRKEGLGEELGLGSKSHDGKNHCFLPGFINSVRAGPNHFAL